MSSHGPWNFCPTATDLRPIGSRCCGPIGAELACGQPGGARGHASRARKLLGPSPPPQLVPELNTPARTRGAERSILQASDPAATYEARAEVAELYDPPAYRGLFSSHPINPVNAKKMSHRIFRHMHGVLNKVYLQNFDTCTEYTLLPI